MKLSDLQDGTSATISSLDAVSPVARKKLMVMGIIPQRDVQKVRVAPMGDPIQIRVLGVDIALRRSLAQSIEVIQQ